MSATQERTTGVGPDVPERLGQPIVRFGPAAVLHSAAHVILPGCGTAAGAVAHRSHVARVSSSSGK